MQLQCTAKLKLGVEALDCGRAWSDWSVSKWELMESVAAGAYTLINGKSCDDASSAVDGRWNATLTNSQGQWVGGWIGDDFGSHAPTWDLCVSKFNFVMYNYHTWSVIWPLTFQVMISNPGQKLSSTLLICATLFHHYPLTVTQNTNEELSHHTRLTVQSWTWWSWRDCETITTVQFHNKMAWSWEGDFIQGIECA